VADFLLCVKRSLSQGFHMGAERILFTRIKPVANKSGEEENIEAVWKENYPPNSLTHKHR